MAFWNEPKKSKGAAAAGAKPVLVVIAGCAGSGKTFLGGQLTRRLGWTYVDKDTVTRGFTDMLLVDKGHTIGDRESSLYCDHIRPVEYQVTLKVCEENLRLGNSVILTAPLIAQIKSYDAWQAMLNKYGIYFDGADVRFIWIAHDIDREYTRINQRNAARDTYKLAHWEEYALGVEDIAPDPRFGAYVFENDSSTVDETDIEDIIRWIKK